MLNNKVKASLTPRADSISTVSPCVWYSMHEGAGQYVADKLGNGGDMQLAAYGTGTPWANAGWLTPDGTNHYLNRSSADTYLNALFAFNGSWAQKLFLIAFYHDGSTTLTEAFFSAGNVNGTDGGFAITLNGSMQVEVVNRGYGSSALGVTSFDAAAITALSSQRIGIVIELLNNGDNTLDANLYYSGALKRTKSSLSMIPNSGTAPWGAVNSAGTRIGARAIGASSQDWLLNRGGSNGRIYDFIAMSRTTEDTSLALAVAEEFHNYPMEFPNSLKAA